MNRHFTKEDMQIANKDIKILKITNDYRNTNTMRYLYTSIRNEGNFKNQPSKERKDAKQLDLDVVGNTK